MRLTSERERLIREKVGMCIESGYEKELLEEIDRLRAELQASQQEILDIREMGHDWF